MNKTIKVALSMLLIFCVFFANMCTVFAVDGDQSTTSGGLTKYDGSLVTYDYAKKNPKIFEDYDIVERDLGNLMNEKVAMWVQNGSRSEDVPKLFAMIHSAITRVSTGENCIDSDCSLCKNNFKYVYCLGEFFDRDFKTNNTISWLGKDEFKLVFSLSPLKFENNSFHFDYSSNNIIGSIYKKVVEIKPYCEFNSGSRSPCNGGECWILGSNSTLVTPVNSFPVSILYPINGKIMPILDGGGNDITPPEHGGGGRPFGNIYDITVSPDLASKDFDVGEIDKIDITITNNSNTNGCFAVNFSKYSAKNTSPRTVMDEAAIFNYREKLHMYDVNGEGRYMYTPAIPLSAKSSKTISIPISYLDLSKLPKDDNGYIYMNFMELAGSVKPGLVSTQFKANKEYYFKLNFKPEYKPPEYGGGTSNEQYPTYDKDGNIVKPSDDPVFEDDWLNWGSNFLKNVTDIFSRIIDGMKSIAEYSGEFFSFLKSAFSFLPPEVWVILAVGISIVILLRIFGR